MFGKRETVAMSIINFIDNYRRNIQYYIKWLFDKNLRTEMSRNKMFMNAYNGKRCFVLGNGPSLKHYDLTKLSEEYVFTVNNMMTTDYFKVVKPNFHLFFDPKFFSFFFHLNPKNDDEKNKMKSIRKSLEQYPKMVCFSSYRLKSIFIKLFPSLNSHYLFNNKIYTSSLKKTSILHRNTPAFQNVITYAINIALYMGFEEIYLLGVDMTGFLEYYEHNAIKDQGGHFYDKTQDDLEKQSKFRDKNRIDNEFYLKNFGKTFEHLKIMQKDVLAKNAKLFNASQHGAIDFLPRVDYESIFSKKTI